MRRLNCHIAVISAFTLVTVVLTYPLIFHLNTHIPLHRDWHPIGAEHWTSMWALWFVEHRIMELHQWSLFSDAVFHPRGLDLTNTMLLGFGFIVAVAMPFVRYFGLIFSFNLFIISSFILTAYATFLLVRYLTHDDRSAFISGIIFAFAPYHMARTISMFGILTSALWIPFYILFFIKAIRDGLTRNLLIAPLLLIFAFTSNPYYAVFLGLFSSIYAFYYIAFDKCVIGRTILLRRLLCMLGVSVLLLIPLFWVILTNWSKDLQVGVPLSPEFGADLLAFFIPSTHHSLWGEFVKPIYYTHFTGNDIEQTVYIGYSLLFLSCIAIVKAPKEETQLWSITALIFFLLSLGPFLHIDGKHVLKINDMHIMLPMPSLLFHLIPLLNAMRAASRFSIILMLALAVLAGYGTRYLLTQIERRLWAVLLCMALIILTITLEFSIIPLPLADARIPRIYDRIATENGKNGAVLDVPLYWFITKYQYYQTRHLKRLLVGQAPRVPLELVQNYADTMPFMKLFRTPELIGNYEHASIDKRDILRFIEFFDLSFIVLHKADMGTPWFDHLMDVGHRPPDAARPRGPEVFDRLLRFLLAHFPIEWMEEEGDIVVLKLARTHQPSDLWMDKDGMTLDFGSTSPHFFLAEGWTASEQSEELTFAWASAKESRLWAYLPQAQNVDMEFRVQPFTFPGSPQQGVKIYVNEQFLSYIPLVTPEWHTYTIHLSQTNLTEGINTFRFIYDYTASPATVFQGNKDRRQLAVNFDYVTFHPQ